MSPRQKLLLLLASARVANLPSVVSNVWLGVALGYPQWHLWQTSEVGSPWLPAASLALAAMLLYIGGNFLNDWHDRHWDACHRPERALPQGAFAPGLYLGLASCCGLAGVAVAGCTSLRSGTVAALIAGCILLYTRHHKQRAWSVLMMGSCRALLPLLFFIEWPLGGLSAATAPATPEYVRSALLTIAAAALALGLFIAALSLLARGEATRPPAAGNALLAPGLMVLSGLLMALALVCMLHGPLWLALLGLPFFLWLARCFTAHRHPPSRQISALLAGLPLLDWVALLPLALVMLSQVRVDAFALTCLLLPPLAFVAGRLLQRLAAAT
ncbi:MAG: UbiA family prenyltransferase [Verrucomicrobia bacterium]|nr:UbiA family prenyltransferase [Verrucomicrobiota bacterium]